MGKLDDNVLVHGLRGKVGNLLVFRIVDGKTIVAKKPSTANRVSSENQIAQQEFFQEAVIYGKRVANTPELAAQYENSVPKGKSLYMVALADFLKAPKIKEVDVSNYTGEAGSTIRIRVIDNFKVSQVNVDVYNSDGGVAEKGQAVLADNGLDWVYTANGSNNNIEGDKIVITASDIPGHKSRSEVNI